MVGLDVFRILAAFAIVAYHSWMHIHVSYKLMDDFVSMAAVYMTGFFMLSGAVLQYMYGDKKILEISVLKNFYWKRFIAIMPLYYFAGFAWMIHYSKESLWQKVAYIPFSLEGFQMLFPGTFNVSHNGGSWFISCIVICYLLYPFMSKIVSQLSIKGTWKLLGIICLNLYLAPLFICMYQRECKIVCVKSNCADLFYAPYWGKQLKGWISNGKT